MNRESTPLTPSITGLDNCLVMIADLQGFAEFANRDGARPHVPRLLHHAFAALRVCIGGETEPGQEYWMPQQAGVVTQSNPALAKPPLHTKFLGDGVLYIWNLDEMYLANVPKSMHESITEPAISKLLANFCNKLWNLRRHFGHVLQRYVDETTSDLPAFAADRLPQNIRFGLARGAVDVVHGLGPEFGDTEYVGRPINLAHRLQNYCPEVGFIASQTLNLPEDTINRHSYVRVRTQDIKGFGPQEVVVDLSEYKRLTKKESLQHSFVPAETMPP